MKVKGRFDHFNINVTDLDKSIKFYETALGLHESHRKEASDGSFVLVYMADDHSNFLLELTWLRDQPSHTSWVRTKAICVCVWKVIMTKFVNSIRKWDVFASRTPLWACISSMILMITGLRYCR